MTERVRAQTLIGRWQATDLRTLWLNRIEAGDDRRVVGFWTRQERGLRRVGQHDLLRQALTLADRLSETASTPGTPVVVDCSTPQATVLAYLASVLAGAYPVINPVHVGARPQGRCQVADLGERLGASCVLTDRREQSVATSNGGRPLVEVRFDPEALPCAAAVPPSLPGPARPDEPAHLQLTSGSTAAAKAVAVTHGNVLANCEALSEIVVMSESDAIVSWLPLYHDMGLVGMALLSLLQGTDLHLLSPFDFLAHPEDWLRAISATGAAITTSPTFGFRLATARTPQAVAAELDLSSLRIAACGAEPVRPDVLGDFARRFAPCGLRPEALRPCYGLAEATLAVTFARPGAPVPLVSLGGAAIHDDGTVTARDAGELSSCRPPDAKAPLVSAGPPVRETDVVIVDPATGEQRCDGLAGEIAVCGPGVTPGFWEDGRVVPRPGTWLRTGDIGLVRDGELFIVDRISNILIRNGQNHAAAALEEALAAACGVDADSVIVVDRDIQDPTSPITGVLEAPRGSDTGALADAAAAAGRLLALPLDDVVVTRRGRLPRTTSGKKQHAALRRALRDETLPALQTRLSAPWAAPSAEEIDLTQPPGDELAALVREEVRRSSKRGGAEHSLGDGMLLREDLGIDSLALFELAVSIEDRTGRSIGPDLLTEVRTVADLLAAARGASGDQPSLRSLQDAYLESIPQVDVLVDHQDGRHLSVAGRSVADFASCNYLGLDHHPAVMDAIDPMVRDWGVHPSWTRAVASPAPYRALEQRLATLVGAPDVLLFPTVSLLHLGVLPALAGPHGALIVDGAAHHSIQEAAELAGSRGAEVLTTRHGDLDDLEVKLGATASKANRIICLDGVYSMSGAVPDLAGVLELAERWDATVYLDDAHGFGILGEQPTAADPYGRRGNGTSRHLGVPHDRLVYVAGLSKAYSSLGAFVTCRSDEDRRRLMTASTMVFSGPVPTASLASALAGLDVNDREGDAIRRRLHELTTDLAEGIRDLDLPVSNSGAFPIVTVTFGPLDAVTSACRVLWDHGVLITPAVFPAVPLDQGGVRFSVTAANTDGEVDRALEALGACRKASNPRPSGKRLSTSS